MDRVDLPPALPGAADAGSRDACRQSDAAVRDRERKLNVAEGDRFTQRRERIACRREFVCDGFPQLRIYEYLRSDRFSGG